eukprot:403332230
MFGYSSRSQQLKPRHVNTQNSNIRILTSFLIVTLLALGQVQAGKALTKKFGDSILTISVTDHDEIVFNAEVPDNQYLAVGFGKGMKNVNMISFQSYKLDVKLPQAHNWFSLERYKPDSNGDDVLSTQVTQGAETGAKITVKRKFDTGVPTDRNFVITREATIQMEAARNDATSDFIKHNHWPEFFSIYISKSGDVYESGGGGGYDFSIYLKHGWVMWAAWGILGLIQIISNRYLKVYWKANRIVHTLSGVSILILTLVMGLLAMQKGSWEISKLWHTLMGFIIMVAVGFIVIGGIMTGVQLYAVRWNTQLVLRVKLGHKIFGYILIFVSQIAIVLGGFKWSSFSNQNNPYVIAHIVVFFLVLIVLEGIYYRFQMNETNFVDPKNTISRADFKKRVAGGEQLVVVDDLVLDVSRFKLSHPGGKFVLDYNVGRDISKFFYGGYTLETSSGLKPHTHSNMARHILNSLVIARLEEKAKSFAARIVSSSEVGKNTNCFHFRAEGPEITFSLPASTDVTAIGRHFLIRSFTNSKVKRHYTVCTSMKKEIYDELCGAIQQFKRGEKVVFNDSVLQENWTNKNAEIVCTVKNYNRVGGVSHRVHTAYNDLYQIKALLGKGLGIHQEGNHVAFVAGTGILVFVDLVAFLIRQNLGLMNQMDSRILHKEKFKFTLYASFPKEEEALCLDLLEGLQEITNKSENKNFELILRISSKTKQRWDNEYIQRQLQLQTQTDLRKIWVCGPPAMNETFDRCLDQLGPQFGLNRNQWEIL